MEHTFRPGHECVGQITGLRTVDEIKNEPMLFGADFNFAKQHGGALTHEALRRLVTVSEVSDYLMGHCEDVNMVIDTRVTHTQKGYYPSIPGWHCDDVPREKLGSGEMSQPLLHRVSRSVQHFMVLVADGYCVSNTEFAESSLTVDIDESRVWASLDEQLNARNYRGREIGVGQIIKFSQTDIHRASPCLTPGWRWFFRLSLTHRKPINEIRNQVQVYLTDNPGW